ncbi:MFS general substrate transporter [Pyrenophora tritici-repentis]|uniref:AraJ, Arabinose efflux permease n=1 Tax=Pyrenophora tritici-repentis TaxID=45151 RepID=A0A2W1I3E2_9PLEO|nr:MFS general substrate transporter [Pyrenophora tritici-repentis]KAF7578794.1 AraJ, Arabinose efflux permease [Pyrenophora tritici-repentis]KAG9389343.1 MFS general substrate transporter [Pyrenophora tritici-repentis]KAI0588767.1 MFS general substrate transporter [Pyrenophora tritici-repentis]KAI0592258.1 MFS general substrate transporter [Pyrenophora tritici-repentis]
MTDITKDSKPSEATVERFEYLPSDEEYSKDGLRQTHTMGTVTITDDTDVYLVPSPSADPRDPLNLSKWRKIVFISLVSIFSSLGLSLVSGFGGLLGFYIPEYAVHGADYADITALMTYPSMFMGVGCLTCMPLALSIGRRPVFLGSLVVLILGALLAAQARDYNWHLGARMVLGFAAGQSEALVPMMIQEIHFMHERSTFLMWQSAIQTVLSAGLTIAASPLAGAVGPANWYRLGAGFSAVTLILSIFLVPESRYPRSLVAYGQSSEFDGVEQVQTTAAPVRLSERPALDTTKYPPRTIRSDMRLFVGEFDWVEGWYGFVHTFQILLFPNVLWAFCLNGLTIGINIAIGTTYGAIVTHPPYNWGNDAASYVNAGQVVVAFVALPLLGNGSDKIIKWRAKRNDGFHEPENRLLVLWIPILFGILSATLYGQAGQYPDKYHWFVIVFANAGYYFCFVGANIAAITYLLDSYPARAGPVLVVITAFRGFVSFGTSYGVAKFIETTGYDGSFGTYAGLTALFGCLGIPIFLYGKRIRAYTGRWATAKHVGVPSMSR